MKVRATAIAFIAGLALVAATIAGCKTSFRAIPHNLLNSAVTQANIQQTICDPLWVRAQLPSADYIANMKEKQFKVLKLVHPNINNFKEDFWIPLQLGGAPKSVLNIGPQVNSDYVKKNREENRLNHKVCSGHMTLAEAQLKMFNNYGPENNLPGIVNKMRHHNN